MIGADYVLALTTGLLGGVGHCIGMCGPFVASCSLGEARGENKNHAEALAKNILYNAGRLSTYAFIGAIMGATGSFVDTAGKIANVQNAALSIAGILMMAMGLRIAGLLPLRKKNENKKSVALKAAGYILEDGATSRYFPLGLIMGFIPCGLSYSVFVWSAGAGGALQGMLVALVFGLGTLPALFLFGSVLSILSARVRGALYRAGGICVVVMGAIYLYRALIYYA